MAARGRTSQQSCGARFMFNYLLNVLSLLSVRMLKSSISQSRAPTARRLVTCVALGARGHVDGSVIGFDETCRLIDRIKILFAHETLQATSAACGTICDSDFDSESDCDFASDCGTFRQRDKGATQMAAATWPGPRVIIPALPPRNVCQSVPAIFRVIFNVLLRHANNA